MVPLDFLECRRGRLGVVSAGCGCGCVPPPPPSSWTDELDDEADDIIVWLGGEAIV